MSLKKSRSGSSGVKLFFSIKRLMFYLYCPRYLHPMDLAVFNSFMSRWYVSYITLDIQIIHLFTIRLVCLIVLCDGMFNI